MKKNLLFLLIALFVFNANNVLGQQKGLHFDRNSCVDIPEISELTGTSARTIEAWVRVPTSNLSWWQPVIIEWGANSSGEKFDFRLDAYRLRIEHGGGYAVATTVLNDSTWHHVAVTLPENSPLSDAKFYIDGDEDPISESSGTVVANTASGNFSIGRAIADDQSVRYWQGDIDEVRLWNKVLTQEELEANMKNELCLDDAQSLVAYYQFNEGENSIAYDETGNYNATLASGEEEDGIPSWIDGVEMGEKQCEEEVQYVQGTCLSFDRNSCVDIPEITDLIGTAARSVEAWILVPSSNLSWWQPVIIEWGANSSGEKFDFRLDTYRLRIEHGGGYATATTALNDSAWHHVVVTLPENSTLSEAKFYIDGHEDPISESSGTVVANTASGDFSIGRAIADDQTVRYWKGAIDEVRLWNKVLSEDDVVSLKDTEVCVDDYSELKAYYKFNEGEGTTAYDETGNNNGTFASGIEEDGVPSWVDGISVVEANCNPTEVISLDKENSFLIYPNPASQKITIETSFNIENIAIYNIMGSLVNVILGADNKTIDISSLQAGIYFIRCQTERNQTITKKIIKQ